MISYFQRVATETGEVHRVRYPIGEANRLWGKIRVGVGRREMKNYRNKR